MSWRAFALVATTWCLPSHAQEEIVDCYYYNGNVAPNNTVCPGSSACCGPTAECQGNRLCRNEGDADGVFVRGPCAVFPYDPRLCATICLEDEDQGLFPRVEQCDDESWCCRSQGDQCCSSGNGTFLDDTGHILTARPTSSSTIASATVSESADATIPAEATSASPSPGDSSSDSGLSSGATIGLGVGLAIGCCIIILLLAILFLLRRRRNRKETENNKDAADQLQPQSAAAYVGHEHDGGAYQDQKDAAETLLVEPTEVEGTIPGQMYRERGRHEVEANTSMPQELEANAGSSRDPKG